MIAEGAGEVRGGVRGHRLRPCARHQVVRHHRAVRRLRLRQGHAYGYGLVAYQTAYLKANYPVEYFAALLTSVKTNLDKAAVYLNECRLMGISVLVPDVNVSDSDFVAVLDADRRHRRLDPVRPLRGAQRRRGAGRSDRGRA